MGSPWESWQTNHGPGFQDSVGEFNLGVAFVSNCHKILQREKSQQPPVLLSIYQSLVDKDSNTRGSGRENISK